MDCDQMFNLINHYMDGGLTQWRQRAVTRHMIECPPCADHHVAHLQFRAVVASKCTEAVPEGLRLRISESLGVQTGGDSPLR